jgi:hypothetical protein
MSLEEKIQRLVYEYDRQQAGLPAQVPEEVKKIHLFPDTLEKYAPPFEARVANLVWEFAYRNYQAQKGPTPFQTFVREFAKSPKNIPYYNDAFGEVSKLLKETLTLEELEKFRGPLPKPKKFFR